MSEVQKDFVVFGASGFTGQFVVEEVAKVAEANGLKFAIAGRNQKKLEDVVREAKKNTKLNFSDVEIIIADVNDSKSLVSMAKQAKVLINCVGPYRFHGIKVVEACIKGGADYVDISGEPQYLEEVQVKFSEDAQKKGVHIVGSCGFDSVPADMGVVFLQKNFGGDINSVEAVVGFSDDSKGNAGIHVTTLECALHGYANRKQLGRIRKKLFKEKLPKSPFRPKSRGMLWWSQEAERWCLPNLASDRSVVMRTQLLNLQLTRQRPLHFNIFFGMTSLWTALGALLFGLIFAAMAPFALTRNLFLKFPGFFSFGAFTRDGAKREDLRDLKFRLTFLAEGWDSALAIPEEQHPRPPNLKKILHVTGPDPGYYGTAIIVTQCALTVLQEKEKLPLEGGVLTPGAAFAQTTLIERLQKNNIEMTLEQE